MVSFSKHWRKSVLRIMTGAQVQNDYSLLTEQHI